MPTATSLTAELKATASRLGLDLVGVAAAQPFITAADTLRQRAAAGMRSPFEEPDIDRRADPATVLPGVRSIIAAGIAYGPDGPTARRELHRTGADRGAPTNADPPGGRGWLSRYCRGEDYHHVLRRRLDALATWLQDRCPGARTHVCVDTDPPLDRAVAERAGLGFFGRSTNLITPSHGTWVFLGEILTDVDLTPDAPASGTCGTCTRCIDACPTAALVAPYALDNGRCLSYVTQMKGFIPEAYRAPMADMIFGCDICQDVCPYNLKPGVLAGSHPELNARPVPGGEAGPPLAALLAMTRGQFRDWFKPTAAAWRGKTVLQRNAVIALGNSGDPRAADLLLTALGDGRPVIRGHAAWALAQLVATSGDDTAAHRARSALAAAAVGEDDPQVRAEIAGALARLETYTKAPG